jgi:hypothetical protein
MIITAMKPRNATRKLRPSNFRAAVGPVWQNPRNHGIIVCNFLPEEINDARGLACY